MGEVGEFSKVSQAVRDFRESWAGMISEPRAMSIGETI